MISSYPSVAGFPSRLELKGSQISRSREPPGPGVSRAAMVVMREGDWMCPSCGNHNYADKINCNRPWDALAGFVFDLNIAARCDRVAWPMTDR